MLDRLIPGLSQARIFAALAIVSCVGAAVAFHLVRVASLEASIARAQSSSDRAEKALSNRIAAEQATVAAAVQHARDEERVMYTNLQKDYDELKNARAADASQLADARQRLYHLARQRRAACPGDADVPQGTAVAGGTPPAVAGELPERDQQLIDRLLRLGAAANEAARQRNLAVRQYELNCLGAR